MASAMPDPRRGAARVFESKRGQHVEGRTRACPRRNRREPYWMTSYSPLNLIRSVASCDLRSSTAYGSDEYTVPPAPITCARSVCLPVATETGSHVVVCNSASFSLEKRSLKIETPSMETMRVPSRMRWVRLIVAWVVALIVVFLGLAEAAA